MQLEEEPKIGLQLLPLSQKVCHFSEHVLFKNSVFEWMNCALFTNSMLV